MKKMKIKFTPTGPLALFGKDKKDHNHNNHFKTMLRDAVISM